VLRITINEEPKKLTLKLEGRVAGPWVGELDRTWHSLCAALEKKALSIDLCDVTYVDREGRKILADIYRQTRAQFEADTPLAEYFAEEARASSPKSGNGSSRDTATKKENQNERSLRFRTG